MIQTKHLREEADKSIRWECQGKKFDELIEMSEALNSTYIEQGGNEVEVSAMYGDDVSECVYVHKLYLSNTLTNVRHSEDGGITYQAIPYVAYYSSKPLEDILAAGYVQGISATSHDYYDIKTFTRIGTTDTRSYFESQRSLKSQKSKIQALTRFIESNLEFAQKLDKYRRKRENDQIRL